MCSASMKWFVPVAMLGGGMRGWTCKSTATEWSSPWIRMEVKVKLKVSPLFTSLSVVAEM